MNIKQAKAFAKGLQQMKLVDVTNIQIEDVFKEPDRLRVSFNYMDFQTNTITIKVDYPSMLELFMQLEYHRTVPKELQHPIY